MKKPADGQSRLLKARRRLSEWRAHHGGRGRPIPSEFWDEAADVARVEGIAETARALQLDPKRLSRLVGQVLTPSGLGAVGSLARTGFVEFDARTLSASESNGKVVLRFEGREGERLHIEVSGASMVEVSALARALWSRPCCS